MRFVDLKKICWNPVVDISNKDNTLVCYQAYLKAKSVYPSVYLVMYTHKNALSTLIIVLLSHYRCDQKQESIHNYSLNGS